MKGKNKEVVFICLSCISIGSLFGSFAGNLQRFEVWQQQQFNNFNQSYNQTFIINENDILPYGLDKSKAGKIASNYQSDILQKCLLLAVAGISSIVALLLASINFEELELNWEVSRIETTAKKQLKVEKIKHQFAMMSLAQRELFKSELQELLELSGGDSTMEASELNATDKFLNANYLIAEGHDLDSAIAMTWGFDKGSSEFEDMKLKFNEWLVS